MKSQDKAFDLFSFGMCLLGIRLILITTFFFFFIVSFNRYETSNGIAYHETARLVPAPGPGLQAYYERSGEYSYPGPNGLITTQFNSGLNGFQAAGSHIPQPPQ